MLYPVELQALDLSRTPAGRGRGIRTHDIQLPKLALYQAELYPDFRNPVSFRVPKLGNATGDTLARQSVSNTPDFKLLSGWQAMFCLPCRHDSN